MAVQTRLSPLEPTATDQRLWNRKAAERVNQLLNVLDGLQREVVALKDRVDGHDAWIDAIDEKNDAQDSRLSALETRMSATETKNDEQDDRLDALEEPPAP